ncbi:MAG: hypothetical protein ACI4WX_10160 [Aristaeellaceae bacterium]
MDEREKWSGIKADYLAGDIPVREIAKKWEVSESRIYKKATSDGWKKMREKIRQKTDERFIARASRVRAKELEVVSTAASRMAEVLSKTVEELSEKPAEMRLASLKGMSALASAIYANTETIMKIYGIQTPAQEEAQKMERKRLALDQRKQRFEEGKVADESKDLDVALSITIRGQEEGKNGEAQADQH